jgi:hypothetical protein
MSRNHDRSMIVCRCPETEIFGSLAPLVAAFERERLWERHRDHRVAAVSDGTDDLSRATAGSARRDIGASALAVQAPMIAGVGMDEPRVAAPLARGKPGRRIDRGVL